MEENKNEYRKGVKVGVCKWCGEFFIKEYAPEKYCCDECRKLSRGMQSRNKSHRWYHRHKHELSEKQRWGLGSGTLGQHMHNDFEKEFNVVEKELNRLGLRKYR